MCYELYDDIALQLTGFNKWLLIQLNHISVEEWKKKSMAQKKKFSTRLHLSKKYTYVLFYLEYNDSSNYLVFQDNNFQRWFKK